MEQFLLLDCDENKQTASPMQHLCTHLLLRKMNWTAQSLVPYKFSAFLHLQQGIDKVTSIIFYGIMFYQLTDKNVLTKS